MEEKPNGPDDELRTIIDDTKPYGNLKDGTSHKTFRNFFSVPMYTNIILGTLYQQIVLAIIFYWGDPWWGKIDLSSEDMLKYGLSSRESVSTLWAYKNFYTTEKTNIWS